MTRRRLSFGLPWRRLGIVLVVALALSLATACGRDRPEPPSPTFAAAMNRGKAYLENRDSAGAIGAFVAAVEEEPESAPALRNLARAQLLAREHDAALTTLERARQAAEESPATAYLTGLALARESRFEEAIPHFEEAVRLDPGAAPLRFQLANAYQATDREAEAALQLRETVRLDPLHSSAHFKLATHARLAGDRETFEREQREFLRLREVLGEEGRSAEALEVSPYTPAETVDAAAAGQKGEPAASAVPVTFARAERPPGAAEAVAAAVLAVDEAGRVTLAVARRDGGLDLLRRSGGAGSGAAGGGWERTEALPAGALPGAREILPGDFHDPAPQSEPFDPVRHATRDLLVLGDGGARLVEQTAPGRFEDATGRAGLAGLGAVDAALWVDAEHDGDLDLLVASAAGLGLWHNRGDGTFVPAPAEVGVAGVGRFSDLAAADLDGDVAVDLVAAREAGGTLVLENLRTGTYRPLPEPPGPWPPARRVAIDHFDRDGTPEALLLADGGAVLAGLGAGPRRLDLGPPAAPAALARLDFDNDGLLDVAVAPAAGGLALWRNAGGGRFVTAGEATGLAGLGLGAAAGRGALFAVDLDADGDTDLGLVAADGLHLLDNRGGDANRQLKVRTVGTKTNPFGVGTRVEVRAGAFSTAREVDGPVAEIGVGDRAELDSVQTLWTNGVVDNQIGVAVGAGSAGAPLIIVEKNVATGSCPFLYAWDGERFAFVSDLLGASPLGLPLARGVMIAADPDELVRIGGAGELAPRGGVFEFEVTSEFREVVYLDQLRLVAVDHPPAVEPEATDKIRPPPFPPSEVWALAAPRPLLAAVGDDGVDRTAELARLDGVYAAPGAPMPPPLRGATRPLGLTLDFGPLAAAAAGRPLVLALTGWIQYGDGSTNIAMSQNPSLEVIPPMLEAETAPGRWRPLDVVVGMPAGKTKTILVDLGGALPPGARRLRLTTTVELRWDRIALYERRPDETLARHRLAPRTARLYHRGFSELRARAPRHPTTPDYRLVSARPPWRTTPSGWATRYGAVDELLAERDGRLAIVNSGDALRLAFDAAALPPVPPGRERTFFFYSVGWDKDADHNCVDGDTVEPLPAEADLDGDWIVRYNTRWVPADRFYPRSDGGGAAGR